MAARELEKELAAKQKVDTQLTKKQQDMMQQQLDQEQVVRNNVQKVILKLRLLFPYKRFLYVFKRLMRMRKMFLNY